jgi:hypothetical protein
MERRSTKHGPVRDDEMTQESEGMVRGTPQRPHAEEWRETEPAGTVPAAGRDAETMPASSGEEIELRSELARLLTRDLFPAGRQALLSALEERGGSPGLTERVAALPSGCRFASAHDVMLALGINAPEASPD